VGRRIADDRLGAIQEHLARAIKTAGKQQVWVSAGETGLCRAEDLRAMLDELSRRRAGDRVPGGFKLASTSKTLMSMAVGDRVEINQVTMGALTSARKTARKRMENPNAIWYSYTQPNGKQLIVRAPDGSPIADKRHNPAVEIMAKMKVGETVTLTTIRSGMYNGLKILARRKLGEPTANWRCENLANGNVRCIRTS